MDVVNVLQGRRKVKQYEVQIFEPHSPAPCGIFWADQNNYRGGLVRNHVKLGISLRVLYCVVNTGYGLGRSLGDCRPALQKGRKYQVVKTQTERHARRSVVWTKQWQIWVFFSFEARRGRLNFVTQAFRDSPNFFSSGLAIPWLIKSSEFIA